MDQRARNKAPAVNQDEKISLNGSDTRTGGSMIMPIDMSIEATTRSMIRNGGNRISLATRGLMQRVAAPTPSRMR